MTILNIIIGILVLGLLATVHELGHFLFAKAAKVTVEQFALGFGPAIFSFQKGNTTYRLNLLPFFAYVKVKGMEPGDNSPGGFNVQSLGKRLLILSGGVIFNLTFALILLVIVFSFALVPSTTISEVVPDTPAFAAGMLPEDHILAINGVNIGSWEDITLEIGRYKEGEPPLDFLLQRGEEEIHIQATPIFDSQEKRYLVGIRPGTMSLSFGRAIIQSFVFFGKLIGLLFYGFGLLFSGQAGVSDFVGPVGIVQIAAEQAQAGFLSLLNIAAFLSVALGITNLLPIPAVDGGRIVFLLIEWVTRRKINPRVENMVHTVGFFLLLALAFLITWNDIARL